LITERLVSLGLNADDQVLGSGRSKYNKVGIPVLAAIVIKRNYAFRVSVAEGHVAVGKRIL
jgi:hypothetical protein